LEQTSAQGMAAGEVNSPEHAVDFGGDVPFIVKTLDGLAELNVAGWG